MVVKIDFNMKNASEISFSRFNRNEYLSVIYYKIKSVSNDTLNKIECIHAI